MSLHPHFPDERIGGHHEAARANALHAKGRCVRCHKKPAPCAWCVQLAKACEICGPGLYCHGGTGHGPRVTTGAA